jgi:hypothetical protein
VNRHVANVDRNDVEHTGVHTTVGRSGAYTPSCDVRSIGGDHAALSLVCLRIVPPGFPRQAQVFSPGIECGRVDGPDLAVWQGRHRPGLAEQTIRTFVGTRAACGYLPSGTWVRAPDECSQPRAEAGLRPCRARRGPL